MRDGTLQEETLITERGKHVCAKAYSVRLTNLYARIFKMEISELLKSVAFIRKLTNKLK